jgi:hypothetical protein
MSWRGLRHKGVEVLRPEEWNAVVDALNDLYSWLFSGISSASFSIIDAVYGHIESARIDSLSAGTASFDARPAAEGRAVLLDGDPISVYQFYGAAQQQITAAIDAARVTSLLEQLYGKAPSAADVTAAVNAAQVTQHAAAINQKLDVTNSLLQQIYGRVPAAPDITGAIDAARVTPLAADIRDYAGRAAAALETYAPLLADIRDHARDVRDVVVRISVDEYGRVGVRIAEPLDAQGRVAVAPPPELLDELRPVSAYGSVSAAENTSGLGVVLYKGGRPFVTLYYRLGGPGVVRLMVSRDGSAWRALREYSLATGGEGTDVIAGVAYPYVMLETPTVGVDAELEIVASR